MGQHACSPPFAPCELCVRSRTTTESATCTPQPEKVKGLDTDTQQYCVQRVSRLQGNISHNSICDLVDDTSNIV